MASWALVLDATVVQVAAAQFAVAAPLAWHDCSATPGIAPGWTLAGGAFVAPAAPPRPAIRVVRALAFRERLPLVRREAVTLAAYQALAAGNAKLLTWLHDQAAATVTNLDDPAVQSGVAELATAGTITAAEAAALLADGTPAEAA